MRQQDDTLGERERETEGGRKEKRKETEQKASGGGKESRVPVQHPESLSESLMWITFASVMCLTESVFVQRVEEFATQQLNCKLIVIIFRTCARETHMAGDKKLPLHSIGQAGNQLEAGNK